MSLADILSGKHVDEGLDDVFKSSAGPSTVIALSKATRRNPVPHKRGAEEGIQEKTSKKTKRLSNDASVEGTLHQEGPGKGKGKRVESDADEEAEAGEGTESTSDDSESEANIPEHETKQKEKRRKSVKKAKYTPPGETREQREERTIFVGNLPVAIVKNKSLKKQLNRHILQYTPTAKIESIRFRSVAFRNPTSALEEEPSKPKSSRQDRELKRAAEWRSLQSEPDRSSRHTAETEKDDEKKYMKPSEKRRVAAIKGELHEHSSATTNAYVVFAHPLPTSSGAAETHLASPQRKVMDPLQAAREAVLKVNGTIFTGHVLRVDLAAKSLNTTEDLGSSTGAMTDPRLSIFVGNLDFASSEDDVRAFFEKIMNEERGRLDTNENQEDQVPRKSWVTRVRLIRDRETQLGKGFAYVQFSDRDCLDEVLALESEKLKFAKRTLRVQRCKTLPGTVPKAVKQQASDRPAYPSPPKTRSQLGSISLPKGDPSLGERLAALPKEARKKVKATDSARVARRLAKKKARMVMEKTEKGGKHLRERKDKKGKRTMNSGRGKKKREPSDRSLQKKNVKK